MRGIMGAGRDRHHITPIASRGQWRARVHTTRCNTVKFTNSNVVSTVAVVVLDYAHFGLFVDGRQISTTSDRDL
jgi:hypothetical protein